MSEKAFFSSEARALVRTSVEAVEALTAAEVVVAVRRYGDRHRATDWLMGSASALVTLVFLLFHPFEFPVEAMPLQIILAFAFGAVASANLWSLKRLLTSNAELTRAVSTAAKTAFVDLGVSRTTGRTGVLVFAAILERRVFVVADVGITSKEALDAIEKARAQMQLAMQSRADLPAFLRGLQALGPALAPSLPRRDDDVNELPDEPVMA